MFVLSSISGGLQFLSVNHTWIYDNYESKFFKRIIFLGETSNTKWFIKNKCIQDSWML